MGAYLMEIIETYHQIILPSNTKTKFLFVAAEILLTYI